ncbi:ergothioneine biosynthesis protein EgtB [Luteimonas sp. MC1750]|uniref:ergothioneine biosynthesis protein EgtB n=1 Tax=Luteimonas sp. MC1750 TaxID=2799326 RepID=UPI001F4137B2|nr:ergothioneine biosynthesis protein EgtB [Luteimonas sp. MC1750]
MSAALADRYASVRSRTVALAAPLSPEDAQLQSMPDASPAKWHLAHTTWFFSRFVLGDAPEDMPAGWDFLFNSYYVGAGPRHARAERGLVSRPTLSEVLAWRRRTDDRVLARLARDELGPEARDVLVLGTHHEEQHQELLLTDIKHAFWTSPLQPAYAPAGPDPGTALDAWPPGDAWQAGDAAHRTGAEWLPRDEAIITVGAPAWPSASADFAYDNETPRHRVLIAAHAIARRPVDNASYAAFVADGGYRTPSLWLSDGWDQLQRGGWQRPLYWHADGVREFTLAGWQARDPGAAVRHLSHYEADAFARWAGARLPTEAEWEASAAALQGVGQCWEWTSSAYGAYPGFRPLAGTLGEYNGKFMSGQLVLRGGSRATPPGHARGTYRNFFAPHARWQFSGLRLARDPA